MKKIAIKRLAAMTEGELQEIYELTYKYGWLVSEERQEGWLPDRAYMEKAKIEDSLSSWVDYGLGELIDTYSDWLNFHLPDGWVDSLMDAFYGSDLNSLYDNFKYWADNPTAALSQEEIKNKILEAAWKILGEEGYFEQDRDYLYETFGPEFIEMYINELTDVDTEEKLRAKWDEATDAYSEYEIAQQFIYENDLEDKFEEYMVGTGYGGVDWFIDLYDIYNVSAQFPQLMENKQFFQELYTVYLENFPGLEEEIEGIDQAHDELENAQGESLQDRIIAFQLGLTTAHHHGTMADHLLEVRMGEGKIILDRISSGPKVDLWNKELEQIIGFKSPSDQEYFTPESAQDGILLIKEVIDIL